MILNLSPNKLDKLAKASKLAFDGTKCLAYLKCVCDEVKALQRICNALLSSGNINSREKGQINRILKNMKGKRPNDWHCVWYVGMTERDLSARMEEKYPRIMELLGVTHQIQLCRLPEVNEQWAWVLESFLAGLV